jgi:hypothetical protein
MDYEEHMELKKSTHFKKIDVPLFNTEINVMFVKSEKELKSVLIGDGLNHKIENVSTEVTHYPCWMCAVVDEWGWKFSSVTNFFLISALSTTVLDYIEEVENKDVIIGLDAADGMDKISTTVLDYIAGVENKDVIIGLDAADGMDKISMVIVDDGVIIKKQLKLHENEK